MIILFTRMLKANTTLEVLVDEKGVRVREKNNGSFKHPKINS